MIAVFDTNVLIAALVTEGLCSKLLHRARVGEFVLILCPFIMNELRRILTKKFRLSPEESDLAMETVSEAAGKIIEHDISIIDICRDSDDDNILACALAAGADYLVTGDSDLLGIKNYQNIGIIRPRDFEALF